MFSFSEKSCQIFFDKYNHQILNVSGGQDGVCFPSGCYNLREYDHLREKTTWFPKGVDYILSLLRDPPTFSR